MERLRVIVDRSRWFRGKGGVGSRLLQLPYEGGKLCCLGFACLAAGNLPEDILGIATPMEILNNRDCLPGAKAYRAAYDRGDGEHDPIFRAIEVNDERHMDDAEREVKLCEILAEVGIDMEFVDGPVSDG